MKATKAKTASTIINAKTEYKGFLGKESKTPIKTIMRTINVTTRLTTVSHGSGNLGGI